MCGFYCTSWNCHCLPLSIYICLHLFYAWGQSPLCFFTAKCKFTRLKHTMSSSILEGDVIMQYLGIASCRPWCCLHLHAWMMCVRSFAAELSAMEGAVLNLHDTLDHRLTGFQCLGVNLLVAPALTLFLLSFSTLDWHPHYLSLGPHAG